MTASMTNAPPVGSAPPVILAAQPMIETQRTDRNHLVPALELAGAGLDVFPVDGKTARLPGGFKIATTHRSKIIDWWTRGPSANVAIRPSVGVVVLDVDPRAHGATNLVRLLDGWELPPTLTVNTGGEIGGLHIYYRMGAGPWRPKLVDGVDLKAHDTGYLVAPPSIHPDTGRRYEWANDLSIADAPDWLIDACRKPVQPAVRPVGRSSGPAGGDRLTGLVRFVLEAQPGERNSRLNWAAHTGRDLDHHQVAEALLRAAQEIGLPLAEAERTIRSGLAGGAR
jgi:hypothetical protein